MEVCNFNLGRDLHVTDCNKMIKWEMQYRALPRDMVLMVTDYGEKTLSD